MIKWRWDVPFLYFSTQVPCRTWTGRTEVRVFRRVEVETRTQASNQVGSTLTPRTEQNPDPLIDGKDPTIRSVSFVKTSWERHVPKLGKHKSTTGDLTGLDGPP